ncbi:GLPGLI family protein [Chryseobacterium sp. 3008163]|uniref:GLPGLI family protein n=1 Tax=Chryseobacterium sp. 3008163 TaxID=2478663 RepID=UPI000F0C52DC|nr:GLPGLI family protein [Chryseobacterium sp. 3008163]AYN02651.1 GLPGLI family protein [Chryseobacterium sp. 3008163]
MNVFLLKICYAIFLIPVLYNSQTAQRFYYELTYRPDKALSDKEKTTTILDINKDKSIYRDYTVMAQDSILKSEMEKMQKSGVYTEMEKMIKMPKFSYRVYKFYPDNNNIAYVDGIEKSFYGYKEKINLPWDILKDKSFIEGYNCQKASLKFGGRIWNAWFTQELPFQDGPYKFGGLPGLIVKIEDSEQDYVWLLKGNKKIDNYNEFSFTDNLYYRGNFNITYISKSKFEKTYNEYKKDPLAAMKGQVKPEMLSQKMPGSDVTYGQMFENQNKVLKKILGSNTNPIEKNQNITQKKK